MKFKYRLPAVLLLGCMCLPAYAHHMAVVVHQQNQVHSLTSLELGKALKSEMKKWPNGSDVVVVLRKDSAPSLEIVERLCKLHKGEGKAFIAAHKGTIVLAGSDDEVMLIVQETAGALGLVDVHDINDKVKVVKIDGRLPLEKGYLPD